MDAGMPMLKVREPEKRFSRYTTITFKRPRPRNNFKHSQKILGPLRPLSASSQPRFQGSIRLNFFFTLPPTWFEKPIDSETKVFVVYKQILSAPIESHLSESKFFPVRLEPTNFSSKTAFLRSRFLFRFRFTARVPRFPITSLTPIRFDSIDRLLTYIVTEWKMTMTF